MTDGPASEDIKERINELDQRFPQGVPWQSVAGLALFVIAEVADAVHDVAAAIREGRS